MGTGNRARPTFVPQQNRHCRQLVTNQTALIGIGCQRFFAKALARNGRPDRIIIDGSQTNREAIVSCDMTNRLQDRSQSQYLTDVFDKARSAPMSVNRHGTDFACLNTLRAAESGFIALQLPQDGVVTNHNAKTLHQAFSGAPPASDVFSANNLHIRSARPFLIFVCIRAHNNLHVSPSSQHHTD